MPKVTKQPDNYPQLMGQGHDFGGTAWETEAMNLPIARTVGGKGKYNVIEILRVWFYSRPQANVDHEFYLMTKDLAAEPDESDPAVICALKERGHYVTSGGYYYWGVKEYDFTDSNGKGLLIAVDRLYLGSIVSNVSGVRWNVKILYRITEVEAAEFVGIAQQQIA